jgi:hypothetical protein
MAKVESNPLYIGALGVNGEVLKTEHRAHFIEEFR